MRIVLIGPPGSGKGSQAKKIEKTFHVPHISTGNIFRKLMHEDSDLGKKIYEYMSQARLVTDELVMQVINDYFNKQSKDNFMFDGFPRTLYQAVELNKIVQIDVAILLNTTLDVVAERVMTRRICSCGEVYSTRTYHSNVCYVCGKELTPRKDDNLTTITDRFNEYEALTLPVVEYYKNQGKLKTVDANLSIDEVFIEIQKILKSIV